MSVTLFTLHGITKQYNSYEEKSLQLREQLVLFPVLYLPSGVSSGI